jgi:hypothetical protein
MPEPFVSDDKIRQIAEAYALDAVDMARDGFHITLDWSDESVRHVEKMLATLHDQMPQARPTDEEIRRFASCLGSYVGEVFRKNHGAEWGIVTLNGQSVLGMSCGTHLIWPLGRAENRTRNGSEDNIWDYFNDLLGRYRFLSAAELNARPTPPKAKKPWWKFW